MSSWSAPPPAPTTPDERTALRTWLDTARPLDLTVAAKSPAGRALVGVLKAMVLAREAAGGLRGNQRRGAGLMKLETALAALVGSMLRRWEAEHSTPCRQSVRQTEFTDRAVGYRPFVDARDALLDMNMLAWVGGIRYQRQLDWQDGSAPTAHSRGVSARLWPTQRLLDLAQSHGVSPSTVKQDFGAVATARPQKPAKIDEPVVVKPFEPKIYGARQSAAAAVCVLPNEATMEALTADVMVANDFAGQFQVIGCTPPRWCRTFTGSVVLGGRWIAKGRSPVYQIMSPSERASLTIDGEPVVEVDLAAAHLTIMLGLLGHSQVASDLYAFDDLDRSFAKQWVLGTLGKGTPVDVRWAPKVKNNPALKSRKPREVGEIIMSRYQFLANPAEAVDDALGLSKLAKFAPPAKLLTHRLMNLEAGCLTVAMSVLRLRGVLALPVHDSLIVQARHEGEAKTALRESFRANVGIVPRVKVSA